MKLSVLGFLALALPAHAADLATLDCTIGKLKPEVATQLEADVVRNLSESGKRPSYDPAVGKGIAAAAGECAKENGWTEMAIKAARNYTLAKLGWPTAQRVLSEHGFDPAMLEAQFQTLGEDMRNRPLTQEEMQELVRASVTEESQQTRENAEMVGEFFQFLNVMQFASFDFSQA
jgi:hypothetical protein